MSYAINSASDTNEGLPMTLLPSVISGLQLIPEPLQFNEIDLNNERLKDPKAKYDCG